MFTAIKCAEAITGALRERVGPNYTGFWVVTQDPVLIQQAGENVVRACSRKGLKEAIDVKLGTPLNCSAIEDETRYIYPRDDNDKKDPDNKLYSFAQKTMRSSGYQDDGYKERDNSDAGGSSITLTTFSIKATPSLACDKIKELDLLVLAARLPSGLHITHKQYCGLVEKQPKFKVPHDRKVHIVDSNFLMEKLPNDAYRLVCNAKRVARLTKLRARNATATDRSKPWLKYSCFGLVSSIVGAYHRLIMDAPGMASLYGYGRYSTNGIRACMCAIPGLFSLLKVMHKTGIARKDIRTNLRLLTYHQATIMRRLNDYDLSYFRKWYARETKLSGVPKAARARYKQLVGNVAKDKQARVVAQLMALEKAQRKAKGLLHED